MKNIQEDIKTGDFKCVYLLYGEEGYLKQQYRQKLLEALVPQEDTMNTAFYEGKNINAKEIIDLAETMPFFAERRVIVLQNTGVFKNKCEELADYISDGLPNYLCMIFVEEEVDKRSRMFKVVKKTGRIGEFSVQDIKTLTRWVLGRMGKEKKKITQQDMERFLTMTGTDMSRIATELEKLLSYTIGREVITREDILAICSAQITNKIFEMVRAVTEKQQEKALQLYYDLLALKEPPMRILFLIARQFNQLLQTREMLADGLGQSELGSKLGLPPFAVKNTVNCARRYTVEELRKAVEDCMSYEEAVKTGKLEDRLSVELLIIQYSR